MITGRDCEKLGMKRVERNIDFWPCWRFNSVEVFTDDHTILEVFNNEEYIPNCNTVQDLMCLLASVQ